MIKAIIFDLDGVLVDAVEWHYLAFNRALRLFGYQIEPQEHSSLYNGLPTAVKLELLSQRVGFPTQLHGFVNQMKQKYTIQLIENSCHPRQELLGLLNYMKGQGYRFAVASNSIRATVEMMLDKMGIRNHFEVVLSNEDVKRPKPEPEIYQKCMERLGVTPEEVMIIEDSIPGIQAARKATENVMIVAGPHEVTQDFVWKNIKFFNDRRKAKAAPGDPAQTKFTPNTVEIVIPMAGLGQRFSAAGYAKPKPMIDVLDKPMIQWVVENIRPKSVPSHFNFICNRSHIEEYQLDKFLARLAPGCNIISVPGVTEGAACTILLAKEFINNHRPLIIANSDQWVEVSIDEFVTLAKRDKRDGLIMTFHATEKKWSYAKVDDTGKVTQVAEKNPISDHATVGIYYFNQGRDFIDAAEEMIRRDIRTNGEFYVCPVYNQLIEQGKNNAIHEIQRGQMHGLGTPEDLTVFISWKQAA